MSTTIKGRGVLPAQPGNVLHFWAQGPGDLLPRGDGTFLFPWFLDRVEGVDRATARWRVNDVLTDTRGWSRAGVVYQEVTDRAQAKLIVRVIPANKTICGAGAAGCYSYGYEPGAPIAEMGVEYLLQPEWAWRYLVNMEAGGHALSAHDMYTAEHQQHPYVGVMGTWENAQAVDGWPSEQEIEQLKKWLHGHAEVTHDEQGGPEQGVTDHAEPWEQAPPVEPEPEPGHSPAACREAADTYLAGKEAQWARSYVKRSAVREIRRELRHILA